MKLDAIFFAAHPDDVELCCGGTVRKIVKIGKTAGIIDLTKGELSTRGSEQLRAKEASAASKILGIKARENLGLQDGNIENSERNRLKVITLIRYYKPKVIFIPHSIDRHPDHSNANLLVRESAFYSGLSKIKSRMDGSNQEAHRPSRIFFYMQTYPFEPSFIVDISNEFKDKVKAISAFKSQFNANGSKDKLTFISDPRFMKYIEARARFYGFQIGADYGEAFYSEEAIKLEVDNIFQA
jgi:bacillithiol biosynthesis deacetylase BshB1